MGYDMIDEQKVSLADNFVVMTFYFNNILFRNARTPMAY